MKLHNIYFRYQRILHRKKRQGQKKLNKLIFLTLFLCLFCFGCKKENPPSVINSYSMKIEIKDGAPSNNVGALFVIGSENYLTDSTQAGAYFKNLDTLINSTLEIQYKDSIQNKAFVWLGTNLNYDNEFTITIKKNGAFLYRKTAYFFDEVFQIN
jgi:hypothetical protein